MFPGYEVIAKLAMGGMAAIYLARKEVTAGVVSDVPDLVVIKALHSHLLEHAAVVAQFRDEAQRTMQIQSQHVVTAYDYRRDATPPFIVLECIEGWSLQHVLAEQSGPLESEVALAVGLQLVRGLGSIHDAGFVHRDLSPSNVMVGRDGNIKIIDLGLALDNAQASRGQASMQGSMRYMSPEQVRGELVDVRSDLFSFGVIMWETLCGQRLFDDADPMAVMHAVAEPVIKPLREVSPSVPPGVAELVEQLLSADAKARPQSAQGVERAFQQFQQLAGEEPHAVLQRWIKPLLGSRSTPSGS